jgi:hypothetical protein
MLPYPFWFSRLPEIIETLAEFRAPYLQRQDIEQLLGVSSRQAANLLKQWTTVHNGVAAHIETSALLTIMRQLAEEPDGRAAINSRTRVLDTIEGARSRAAEKRLQVKTTPAFLRVTLDSLPPGVTLAPAPSPSITPASASRSSDSRSKRLRTTLTASSRFVVLILATRTSTKVP